MARQQPNHPFQLEQHYCYNCEESEFHPWRIKHLSIAHFGDFLVYNKRYQIREERRGKQPTNQEREEAINESEI